MANYKSPMMHVVRKSIPIKRGPDANTETVAQVPFMKSVKRKGETDENGWFECTYTENTGRSGVNVWMGYVREEWVSQHQVHDIAGLYYVNQTRLTFPTYLVYGAKKPCGEIQPGAVVKVMAWCKPYALTNRGWARVDLVSDPANQTTCCLVRKEPEDDDGISDMMRAVVLVAMDDYVHCPRLRPGITRWAQSDAFEVFLGESRDQFLRTCRERAAVYDNSRLVR